MKKEMLTDVDKTIKFKKDLMLYISKLMLDQPSQVFCYELKKDYLKLEADVKKLEKERGLY